MTEMFSASHERFVVVDVQPEGTVLEVGLTRQGANEIGDVESVEFQDGDFKCACSSACTTGAMVFGDINDKESKVSELKANDRMYHLLESVGTKPNVMYQTKIRNT